MKHLIEVAARLSVSIEVANLPESWRYIHSTHRVILSNVLSSAQTHAALAMALGHASVGDDPVTENSAAEAESRGADLHAKDLFLDVVDRLHL